MVITHCIWLISLVAIGNGYSTEKITEAKLRDQSINLNHQVMKPTFMNNIKRGIDGNEESFEDKKSRLFRQLQRKEYGKDITLLSECKDSNLLYSCFSYPKEFLKYWQKKQGDISKLGSFSTTQKRDLKYVPQGPTQSVVLKSSKISAYAAEFNDPQWNRQFYVQDYRTDNRPVMDLNVVPAYRLGFTGKGVKILVVDSGVDVKHEDLEGNNLADLNYDYCTDKQEAVWFTNVAGATLETHGTQVAGVIAMIARNGKAGVGIAYDAKFAAVRYYCELEEIKHFMNPSDENDLNTWHMQTPSDDIMYTYKLLVSKALNHNLDVIDIYSNSWGTQISPSSLQIIHPLINKALMVGITEGRGKKGAIYVFAAGNSKYNGDNCATDCYVNHLATIPVAAAGQDGKTTVYSSRCTAIFTTAYSGDGKGSEKLVTTSILGATVNNFGGTSAATPLVTGIIALALEAKPELTYRDVMHLIVRSSEVAPLANNKNSWIKNAAGFWTSSDFGFGLLNAERMVSLALRWTTVPKQVTCTMTVKPPRHPASLTIKRHVLVTFNTDECNFLNHEDINHLEQIVITPHINYGARGAISLYLTSPKGTTFKILEGRKEDTTDEGFNGHGIRSVHYWGENPKGLWKIEIATAILWRKISASWSNPNTIDKFVISLYGTHDEPKFPSRTYDSFRLPDLREQL